MKCTSMVIHVDHSDDSMSTYVSIAVRRFDLSSPDLEEPAFYGRRVELLADQATSRAIASVIADGLRNYNRAQYSDQPF